MRGKHGTRTQDEKRKQESSRLAVQGCACFGMTAFPLCLSLQHVHSLTAHKQNVGYAWDCRVSNSAIHTVSIALSRLPFKPTLIVSPESHLARHLRVEILAETLKPSTSKAASLGFYISFFQPQSRERVRRGSRGPDRVSKGRRGGGGGSNCWKQSGPWD